jgi:ABC-type multidrug transport system fused ATPase/permease subunit
LSRVKKHVKATQARALDESATLLEAADEAVRHAELWSSYRATGRIRARVARAGEALTRRVAHAAAFTAGVSGATEALGALALLLVVASSVWWEPSPHGGGSLLVFAVAFFMAYKPIRELAEARIAWARAAVAAERLGLGRLAANADPKDADDESPNAPTLPPIAPKLLELRGLRLERGKLGIIDARIEAGTIVVIRGATGIGKTTLLRTLLGFSRLRSGEVRYGGAVRGDPPFAWVPQDAPIVCGTLAENVALGGTGDVSAAMAAIGALDLLERLGDARLGVGGRALSGGEQKQVAIARALATHKPVLLLDEPTTGLDDRAQAAVLAAVARLRGERTVLLVTHRPEPLAIADAVISLTEGRASRDEDRPEP